jgi:hypothetical protein
MPTDALLTLGMLKLTSLILAWTRGELEREILRQMTKFGDAFARTWQLNYPVLSMKKRG